MNRILKYFFLSMVFVPLWAYIVRELYGQKVAGLTIYGNVSVLLLIILILTRGIRNVKFPSYSILLLLLSIYVGVWDFFNGTVDERGVAIVLFRNYHFFALTTIILIENTNFSEKFIKQLVFLFSLTIIPAFIVSMIQATIDPLFFTPPSYLEENAAWLGNQYEMRPPSIYAFLYVNDLGLSFVPLMSLLLGYRLRNARPKSTTYVLMILAGLVCVASNGRYIMIIFLVILTQTVMFTKLKFSKIVSIGLWSSLGIVIIVTVLVNVLGYDLGAYIQQRILSGSAETRIMAFAYLYEFFPHNPIFGTGVRVTGELYSEIQYTSSQIHVGYLSLLFEYGIVGGLLTFPLWFKMTKEFFAVAKVTRFYGAYLGFVTFLLSNLALVQYDIYCYGIMFLFVLSNTCMNSPHN